MGNWQRRQAYSSTFSEKRLEIALEIKGKLLKDGGLNEQKKGLSRAEGLREAK